MADVKMSPREGEIVNLLLQGCGNAEIAKQLNMNRRTVKDYFRRLFLRFGINDGATPFRPCAKRVKLAILLREGGKVRGRAPGISDREWIVIKAVAAGFINRDIASQLGTTESGVKYSLRLIYDKIGVWNRVELALWFTSRE